MIPKNLEKLFSVDSYDFYKIEETGFSNAELADSYHLYEDFFENGLEYVSAFEAIYNHGLYAENKISQIWIFKDETPIGICMGIHNDKDIFLKAKDLNFKANIAGYIQLYIKDEHRGQGLAGKCIGLLESMVEKNNGYPNAFIMQDDAYPFGKLLQHGCAVSSKINHGDNFLNRGQLKEFCKKIINDQAILQEYKKDYPKFSQEHNTYIEKNHHQKNLNPL